MLKKLVAYIVLNVILAIAVDDIASQNLNFVNYNDARLWYNPANTGLLFNSDISLGFSQNFQEISGFSNYNTSNVQADARVLYNKLLDGWLGLGTNVIYDNTGNAQLIGTQYYFSVAYHQVFATKNILSFGGSYGIINRSLKLSGLTFGDQFDGEGFNNPTAEANILPNSNTSNYQIGLIWTSFIRKNFDLSVGLSANFTNNAKNFFFTNTTDEKDNNQNFSVPESYRAFFKTIFSPSNSSITFIGDVYTTYHNSSLQNTVITGIEYNIFGKNNYFLDYANSIKMYFGVGTRNLSSAILAFGMKYKTFQFLVNYEGRFSKLPFSLNLNNLFEISLVKNIRFKRKLKRNNHRKKTVVCATRF